MSKTIKRPTNWADLPLFLTIAEASKLLHISVETARRLCATGSLKAIKTSEKGCWRISRDSIRSQVDEIYSREKL